MDSQSPKRVLKKKGANLNISGNLCSIFKTSIGYVKVVHVSMTNCAREDGNQKFVSLWT